MASRTSAGCCSTQSSSSAVGVNLHGCAARLAQRQRAPLSNFAGSALGEFVRGETLLARELDSDVRAGIGFGARALRDLAASSTCTRSQLLFEGRLRERRTSHRRTS